MAKHYFVSDGRRIGYDIYREDPDGGQNLVRVAGCEVADDRDDDEQLAALQDDALTLARIVTKAHEIGLRETLKRLLMPEETGA